MKSNGKWIFAAAAAVVIVAAVGYFGTRQSPSDDASTGAIGAVKKYRAPQISEQDVVLGSEATPSWAPYSDFLAHAAALGSASNTIESLGAKLEAMTALEMGTKLDSVRQELVARGEALGQQTLAGMRSVMAASGMALESKSAATFENLKQQYTELAAKLGSSDTMDLDKLPGTVDRVIAFATQLNAASSVDAGSLEKAGQRFSELAAKLENASDLDRNSGPLDKEIDATRNMVLASQQVLEMRRLNDAVNYTTALSLQAKELGSTIAALDKVYTNLAASSELGAKVQGVQFAKQFTEIASKLFEQKSGLEQKAVLGLQAQFSAMTLQQKSLESMRQSLDMATRSLESRGEALDADGSRVLTSLKAFGEVLGSSEIDTNRQLGELAKQQSGALDVVLAANSDNELGVGTFQALTGHYNALAASATQSGALGSSDLQALDANLGNLKLRAKALESKALESKTMESKTGTE